jgi:hypothetical protein
VRDVRHQPRVGEESERTCGACSQELQGIAYFCPFCGTDLRADDAGVSASDFVPQVQAGDSLAPREADKDSADREAPSKRTVFLPQPPAQVDAIVQDHDVLIQWSRSPTPGSVEYIICRKPGGAPSSPDDGEVIGRTSETSMRDRSVRAGDEVYYSVFAVSDGLVSGPTSSPGVVIPAEVQELSVAPANGFVSGSWKLDVPGARVRVFRRDLAQPSDWVEVPVDSPNSFLDRHIRPNSTYEYRVCVEYPRKSGTPIQTPGLAVRVHIAGGSRSHLALAAGLGSSLAALLAIGYWVLSQRQVDHALPLPDREARSVWTAIPPVSHTPPKPPAAPVGASSERVAEAPRVDLPRPALPTVGVRKKATPAQVVTDNKQRCAQDPFAEGCGISIPEVRTEFERLPDGQPLVR